MERFLNIMRSLIPTPIKRNLRAIHRHFIFRRAMGKFIENPQACAHAGNPVLKDLVYGWGNESWSALDEYLAACIRHVMETNGPTLECGSGLSTILMGVIVKQQGRCHWALEHSQDWANTVRGVLVKYDLESAVVLSSQPLKDYGDFYWYDPPIQSMPDIFNLVICDGPPGTTKGGRYGLVPIMGERLPKGCIILLDDAERAEECEIANRWGSEVGSTVERCGVEKPYIRLTVNSGGSRTKTRRPGPTPPART